MPPPPSLRHWTVWWICSVVSCLRNKRLCARFAGDFALIFSFIAWRGVAYMYKTSKLSCQFNPVQFSWVHSLWTWLSAVLTFRFQTTQEKYANKYATDASDATAKTQREERCLFLRWTQGCERGLWRDVMWSWCHDKRLVTRSNYQRTCAYLAR